MKRVIIPASLAAVILAALVLSIFPQLVTGADEKMMMAMPLGGKEDVDFANTAWKAMKGYDKWMIKTEVMQGNSPHGAFVRIYYNIVNVDEKPYHVIIKDNFMGKDAKGKDVKLKNVAKSPEKYLAAVTVMIQREAGYDMDNNNWFWVKYKADGTIDVNPNGVALAGRVAKGMDSGCIFCHKKNAMDGDYFFTNDARK